MKNLTERQKKILKAIIEEYIDTADLVGSETLEKKYELGISPATIRNEMAILTEAGFLKKPHSSAGRSPTSFALKYYINELMEKKSLSTKDEVSVKEKIWDSRMEFNKLLKEATKALAEKTKMLALATTDKKELYYAGAYQILDMPEFFDIDVTRMALSLLDEEVKICDLLTRAINEDPIHILFGEEAGLEFLEPCGFVYTHFQSGPRSGAIGVLGPARINYSYVIPVIEYFGDLISELGRI